MARKRGLEGEQGIVKINEYLSVPTHCTIYRVFDMGSFASAVILHPDFVELEILKNANDSSVFAKMLVFLTQEDIVKFVDSIDTNKEFVKQYQDDHGYYYFSVFMGDGGYVVELYVKNAGNIASTVFSLDHDDMDVLITALTGKSRRSDIEIVRVKNISVLEGCGA
jgi:hypothetical protein